jgi:hypothetical protein
LNYKHFLLEINKKDGLEKNEFHNTKFTIRYFSPIELRNGTLSSGKHLKNCLTLIKSIEITIKFYQS